MGVGEGAGSDGLLRVVRVFFGLLAVCLWTVKTMKTRPHRAGPRRARRQDRLESGSRFHRARTA